MQKRSLKYEGVLDKNGTLLVNSYEVKSKLNWHDMGIGLVGSGLGWMWSRYGENIKKKEGAVLQLQKKVDEMVKNRAETANE